MKKSQRKNNFNESIRFYMLEDTYWRCWACGRNQADCLHHIFGRGREEGCEKSIFNAAPMCNHRCHLARHGYWMTQEGRRFLLQKTIDRLSELEYTLNKTDHEFLEKYGLEIYRLRIKI